MKNCVFDMMCKKMVKMTMLFLLFSLSFFSSSVMAIDTSDVIVETTKEGTGPDVTREHKYKAHVTLYILHDWETKEKTKSGWSTRQIDGAAVDKPFEFQPGIGLIVGWTQGVLQMREGERANLLVPNQLGYGGGKMGSPNGSFYIPQYSDLLFDIEILGKVSMDDDGKSDL